VSAGILRSLKGPNGGYRLARPTAGITLLEVVEAAKGSVRGDAPAVGDNDALRRRLQGVCAKAAGLVREGLGAVTRKDLAGGPRRK